MLEFLSISYKLQLTTCLFMTGLIWIVQLVHYPSFRFIAHNEFLKFSSFHQNRISLIVAPVMLIEAVTATILVFLETPEVFYWINLLGVIGIWLVTITLSMPQHNRLSKEFSIDAINKLIDTNWLRTFLWSLRSAFLLFYLGSAL